MNRTELLRQVKERDEALKEINHANGSVQNIAAIAQEQAALSKEVVTAIDSATKSTIDTMSAMTNIRGAADETASAAQSVAEQSEAMATNAQLLTDTLSQFKLPSRAKSDLEVQ